MAPRLTLFFDIVSPYSWFAFEVLCRYRPLWGLEVDFVPCHLAAIMKVSGYKSPTSSPFTANYLIADLIRTGAAIGVPIKGYPRQFPLNTLKAQHLLTYVKANDPSKLVPATLALWRTYWGDGVSIDKDDVLLPCLTPVLGADKAKAYLAVCESDPATKQKLADETKRATDIGVFGAPWIVVEREVDGKTVLDSFYGSDRFESIAMLIGKPYHGLNPGTGTKL